MTDEEQTLLVIRGTIAGMPEDDQIRVKAIAETFRNVGFTASHAGLGAFLMQSTFCDGGSCRHE